MSVSVHILQSRGGSLVTILLCALLWTGHVRPAEAEVSAPAYEPKIAAPGFLILDRKMPVVHVFGTPQQRGQQLGELLKPQIEYFCHEYVWEILSEQKRESIKTLIYGMESKIPEALRDEMRGVAKGSGLDYGDILLLNSFVDLVGPYTGSGMAVLPEKSTSGKSLIAANYNWYELDSGGLPQPYVLVVHPSGDATPHVSVSMPGLVGVFAGMNVEGLALNHLPMQDVEARQVGMPNILSYRKMLEQKSAIDGIIPFFEGSPVIGSANLLAGDTTGKLTVAELDVLWGHAPREPKDGFLVATTFLYGKKEEASPYDMPYRKLESSAKGRSLHSFLTMRTNLGAVAPSSEWGNKQNVASVIMEPQRKVLYLSLLDVPAAKSKFLRLDVTKLCATPPAEPKPETEKGEPVEEKASATKSEPAATQPVE